MASKVQRMQHLTIALCEGFVDMIWEHTYSKRENNKTFSKMRQDVKEQCENIRTTLKNEGGLITLKDVTQIRKVIDIAKVDFLKNDQFTSMMAIAIMVDMIVYQLTFVKEKKQKLFEQLLFKTNYLVRYFDQKRDWIDPEERCLKATETIRQLMGI